MDDTTSVTRVLGLLKFSATSWMELIRRTEMISVKKKYISGGLAASFHGTTNSLVSRLHKVSDSQPQ